MSGWESIKWDKDKIRCFWDFAAQSEAYKEDYFSKQVGKGIVRFLQDINLLKGRVLDYGCGPGFLLNELLALDVPCEGVDFSLESVNIVNAKFSGNPLWKGANQIDSVKLPYPDDTFDLIICIEAIEHIIDPFFDQTLNEWRRILKPKTGSLFITTPNNENLAKNYVFCPECKKVFHRYQHVKTFNKNSLTDLMESYKFETLLCDVTAFNLFQKASYLSPLDWTLRHLLSLLNNEIKGILRLFNFSLSRKYPYSIMQKIGTGNHLFWFGKKD